MGIWKRVQGKSPCHNAPLLHDYLLRLLLACPAESCDDIPAMNELKRELTQQLTLIARDKDDLRDAIRIDEEALANSSKPTRRTRSSAQPKKVKGLKDSIARNQAELEQATTKWTVCNKAIQFLGYKQEYIQQSAAIRGMSNPADKNLAEKQQARLEGMLNGLMQYLAEKEAFGDSDLSEDDVEVVGGPEKKRRWTLPPQPRVTKRVKVITAGDSSKTAGTSAGVPEVAPKAADTQQDITATASQVIGVHDDANQPKAVVDNAVPRDDTEIPGSIRSTTAEDQLSEPGVTAATDSVIHTPEATGAEPKDAKANAVDSSAVNSNTATSNTTESGASDKSNTTSSNTVDHSTNSKSSGASVVMEPGTSASATQSTAAGITPTNDIERGLAALALLGLQIDDPRAQALLALLAPPLPGSAQAAINVDDDDDDDNDNNGDNGGPAVVPSGHGLASDVPIVVPDQAPDALQLPGIISNDRESRCNTILRSYASNPTDTNLARLKTTDCAYIRGHAARVPLSGLIDRRVIVWILTTSNGQGETHCIYHYYANKDQGSNTHDIASEEARTAVLGKKSVTKAVKALGRILVTGIPQPKTKSPLPGYCHCGCSIDDAVMSFSLWKTLKIQSVSTGHSEGWGFGKRQKPRDRAFLLAGVQKYGLMKVNDIYNLWDEAWELRLARLCL
ncbi:hypothetical protein VNI00_014363 [Paramarasmius palmivorus]|uniref:Uncharacterized protein n=1 Tax=Paramarasmius palmivorus TaxID=297713 RepID=A0AAW0BRW7_9AGAR